MTHLTIPRTRNGSTAQTAVSPNTSVWVWNVETVSPELTEPLPPDLADCKPDLRDIARYVPYRSSWRVRENGTYRAVSEPLRP